MAEFEAGNLYDLNKMLVEQNDKKIEGTKLINKIKDVTTIYFQEKTLNFQYFMLLCHEKRDYTIFKMNKNLSSEKNILLTQETLRQCFLNRGAVYSLERTEDKQAIEIWLKDKEEHQIFCYYLFPCDPMVVEIGEES